MWLPMQIVQGERVGGGGGGGESLIDRVNNDEW